MVALGYVAANNNTGFTYSQLAILAAFTNFIDVTA
jgi:hypothetical protein